MLLAGCGGSTPQGTIVFSGVVHGDRGIYSVDVDGSHLRRLATRGSQVAWSSGADRLAFLRDDEIWVISRSGGGLRRIVRGPAYEYSWSPDGTQVAYLGDDFRLLVATLGGAARSLTGDGRNPVWSPDGRWIAFLTSVAHANDQVEREYVAIVRPDGTGKQRLQLGLATGVSWSPDARSLAFAAPADGLDGDLSLSLYTVLRDGTDLRAVVSRVRFLNGGDWSPDGKLIAFADGAGTWVVDRSGIRLHRVSRLEYGSWAPDGRLLVVHDARHLWVVSAGGARANEVIAVDAVDSVTWLPPR